MTRNILRAAAGAAALSAAACVETASTGTATIVAAAPEARTSAATWRMPWQISPISQLTSAQAAEMIVAWVPETGYVRGTRTALASVGAPLAAVPGPNRTVATCRSVVQGEAGKLGARAVEAVSAGPHRRNAQGHYIAPVRVRITYARSSGIEVRESVMTCIVDREGRIVDAYA